MVKDPTNSKLIPGVGRQPLPAYRGDASYIFVSYAHADSYRVFPEILRFQDMGYNIWYDEGICAGNEWLDNILEHLENADLFIVFVTNNSVQSSNVKKEFRYAIDENKFILPIYLEDFNEIEMDREWKYELRGIQGILKTTLNEEEYVFKFTEAFEDFGFELKSQSVKRPDSPYRGDEPYIFINFALGDSDLVFGEIKRLQDSGVKVFWHDGTFSSDEIYDAIKNSSAVVSFISPALVRLDSCRDEISFALMEDKSIILVYLNKTDLPAGLKLLLQDKKSILQYDMVESEYQAQLNACLKSYGFDMSGDDESHILKRPSKPYKGSNNYIYVSYAHSDAERVFPLIKRFQDDGYPIWYDEGMAPGNEWQSEMADALLNSSLLVVFISDNSMSSANVKDEIRFALAQKLNILSIYLDETQLPHQLEFLLANMFSIFKYQIPDEKYMSLCIKFFDENGVSKILD